MTSPSPSTLSSKIFGTLLLVYWLLLVFLRIRSESDTFYMVTQLREAVACAQNGSWNNCPKAGHFPLIQMVIGFPFFALGLSDAWIVRALSILNGTAFVATLYFIRNHFKSRPVHFHWILLSIILSPYIYYSRSSFAEIFAACLHVCLILALLQNRSPWLIGGLALFCGLTKDTIHVFTMGVGLLACRKVFSRQAFGLLGGCTLGFLILIAFQYFRFGMPYNAYNLRPLFMTPDHSVLTFFLGQWFTPNIGILFIWPLFTLSLGVVLWKKMLDDRRGLPHLGSLLILLLALTFGLAHWWAPFGSIAWGPRLTIPLLFPVFILLVEFHGTAFLQGWQSLPRMLRILLLGTTLILSIPQIMVTAIPARMIDINSEARPECNIGKTIDQDPEGYYRCMNARIWKPDDWIVSRSLRLLIQFPETALVFFIYGGFIFGLLRRNRESIFGNKISL